MAAPIAPDLHDRIRARARELAAQAPPLSVAQRDRLVAIFRSVANTTGATPRPRRSPE